MTSKSSVAGLVTPGQRATSEPPRPRRPLARLGGTIARIPRYLNLAQGLLRDPNVSVPRKVALGFGVAYVALPVDLIPGIIPILGQLDDLSALLLGLRTALRGCEPDAARAHIARVGLAESALDADIRTVQVVALWFGLQTVGRGAGLLLKPIRSAVSLIGGTVGRGRSAVRGGGSGVRVFS